MADDTIRCERCAFFRHEAGYNGRCHRFPPAADFDHARVKTGDWCGEWTAIAAYAVVKAPDAP